MLQAAAAHTALYPVVRHFLFRVVIGQTRWPRPMEVFELMYVLDLVIEYANIVRTVHPYIVSKEQVIYAQYGPYLNCVSGMMDRAVRH